MGIYLVQFLLKEAIDNLVIDSSRDIRVWHSCMIKMIVALYVSCVISLGSLAAHLGVLCFKVIAFFDKKRRSRMKNVVWRIILITAKCHFGH